MDHAAPLTPVNIDWDAVMARHAAYEAKTASLMPLNKAALFDALQTVGITMVTVAFDGDGDFGQIESVDAVASDAPADLPRVQIALLRAQPDGSGTETAIMSVADAIEDLAYQLLTKSHPGWENNDGAYGEFRFDVSARTITLDHNDRYTAVESFEHEW
ncbi:DUF6878 family protein [Sphingobium yanoikuyae]|jgi:hypothetical protein|uniref:DUF6878 family protein n=1 Tax=Sphingobium yanoikuyae TaxID=13690 RepID=UPI0035C816C6